MDTLIALLETAHIYIIHVLRTSSIFLASAAENFEQLSPSHQCAEHLRSLSSFLDSAFNALPAFVRSALAVVFIAILLTLLVFLLPKLFGYLLGTDPVLDTVPAPWKEYDPYADDQSDSFIDEDVQPLLCEQSESSLKCVNPATGNVIGYVPKDTPKTLAEKVARARKAQKAWSLTSFEQRRKLMRVLRDHILENQVLLAGVCRQDTGKTLLDASLGEIVTTLEKLRWVIAEGEEALTNDYRSIGPLAIHKRACVEYMPLGVIAAIAPWNYPLHNFYNPLISSLFAGNAIVVKPSEHTAFSSVYFARIARRALALCGHSPELVQVLVGEGDIGAALVDAQVDKIFFTGSTKIGKLVAAAAAKRLVPTVLELGGKDAFIVCDDAHISHALSFCLRGVYQNAGQNCIGVERVFLHSAIRDKFLQLAVDAVRKIRLGVDMGAMTMGTASLDHIEQLIEDATSKGARILVGGRRTAVNGAGFYFEATILDGVTMDMRIAREEVFGPVMSVFSWDNDSDLLTEVNSSAFGLGASVFSKNSVRASRIMSALRVGMSNTNDFAINYLCQSMPFGGTKESGSDKFAGIEGLRGCCLPKATTRDRFPLVRTVLPTNLQYPTSENAFAITAEINDLVYSNGILSKLDSARNLLVQLCASSWMPRTRRADIDNVA